MLHGPITGTEERELLGTEYPCCRESETGVCPQHVQQAAVDAEYAELDLLQRRTRKTYKELRKAL